MAAHKVNDLENSNTVWSAKNEQTDVRFRYRAERLQFSVGASIIDLARDFEQLVTGGTRQDLFPVAYRGDTTFYDGTIAFQSTESMTLGGSFRKYDNDGSFDSDRRDFNVYAEYDLPGNHRLRLSYQNVDYEDAIERYDTDILEMGVGLRW